MSNHSETRAGDAADTSMDNRRSEQFGATETISAIGDLAQGLGGLAGGTAAVIGAVKRSGGGKGKSGDPAPPSTEQK